MNCQGGKILSLFSKFPLLVNIVSFHPPTKYLYEIDEKNKKEIEETKDDKANKFFKTRKLYETIFTHDDYEELKISEYKWIQINSYIIKKKKDKGNSVVVLYIKNKSLLHNEKNEPYTILHSHGNASSLGTIYSFLLDLSTQLKCHVISYDYNGYGKSKGKPNEKHLISNVDDVYSFLVHYLKVNPQKIIIYGYSIGTVPSCDIASKEVGGLILHSPIASARLIADSQFDISEDNIYDDSFCNWARAGNIKCPTFIIHGKEDTLIPYNHSLLLEEKFNHLMKWYPENGNHVNIYEKYRYKFIAKINKFLAIIKSDYDKEHENHVNKKKKIVTPTPNPTPNSTPNSNLTPTPNPTANPNPTPTPDPIPNPTFSTTTTSTSTHENTITNNKPSSQDNNNQEDNHKSE